MTSTTAMADLVLQATKLSLAREFAKNYPGAENDEYVRRVKMRYDAAYRLYTDPFGVKTHA